VCSVAFYYIMMGYFWGGLSKNGQALI